MLKIAFVLGSYPNISETFIYNQIYYLIKNEFEVEILALKETENDLIHSKFKKYSNFRRVRFVKRELSLWYILNFISNLNRSFRLVSDLGVKKSYLIIHNLHLFKKINSFDIIHSHFGYVGELIGKLYKYKILTTPKFINTFHGFDLLPNKLPSYNVVYKNLIEFSNILTVNSNYTKNLLLNISDQLISKTKILPMGIDFDFFNGSKYFGKKNDFIILFCGRLVSWKAPDLALLIFKNFNQLRPNSKLIIVGDGELRSMCKEFVDRNQIVHSVTFTGAISQERLIEIMMESDVLIMPGVTDPITGRAENQGLIIQEAQAMTLPVIVSNAGGMSEGLIQGKSGFVVDERDVESFINKLILLVDNPDVKSLMGKNGEFFVKSKFDFNILGEKLVELYK